MSWKNTRNIFTMYKNSFIPEASFSVRQAFCSQGLLLGKYNQNICWLRPNKVNCINSQSLETTNNQNFITNNHQDTHLPGVGGLEIGLQRHVGERHLHGVFNAVQELNHHVGDVLEGEFPSLGSAEGRPNLQRVEQQWLEETRQGAGGGRQVSHTQGLAPGVKAIRRPATTTTTIRSRGF